jgi:hypothetical protein
MTDLSDLRPRCGNFGYAVMAALLLATIAVLLGDVR